MMSLARTWLLALCIPLAAGQAQVPTVESTAVAARAELLPVVDDDGNVIPESEIEARLRGPRWRIMRPLVGALAGTLLFAVFNTPEAQCVSWDPCTPREEWRIEAGPLFGLVVGAVVGAATPDGRVDRWRAVELIRAERRGAKGTTSP